MPGVCKDAAVLYLGHNFPYGQWKNYYMKSILNIPLKEICCFSLVSDYSSDFIPVFEKLPGSVSRKCIWLWKIPAFTCRWISPAKCEIGKRHVKEPDRVNAMGFCNKKILWKLKEKWNKILGISLTQILSAFKSLEPRAISHLNIAYWIEK